MVFERSRNVDEQSGDCFVKYKIIAEAATIHILTLAVDTATFPSGTNQAGDDGIVPLCAKM